MIAAFTPVALLVQSALAVRSPHILFLIPVIIAATRLGVVAALAAAFVAVAATAFFFYPPIYDIRVFSPDDAIALAMFVAVAMITSHLSAVSRRHASMAARNYRQLELLYAFSRNLAATRSAEEIVAAIQAHASALVGREVAVVTFEAGEVWSLASKDLARLAPPVREGILRLAHGEEPEGGRLASDASGTRHWLLRSFSRNAKSFGVLVVELDRDTISGLDEVRTGVDLLLQEAAATLDRLDLANTVSEAELRQRSEALREAIIGSTSHGLRTPLASILGSASVIADAPAIADDVRLRSLAQIIVTEAERLNGDIQKMLDAATLSSGLRPDLAWHEPADLINAATRARHREMAGHQVVIDCPHDLPLVRADGALTSSALGLILDNAARYSGSGSEIRMTACAHAGTVEIAIEDEGSGLAPDELPHIFEKFYRGSHARASTLGTGLGLWIADAFVGASHGRISAARREGRRGTRITMSLPAATPDQMEELGGSED